MRLKNKKALITGASKGIGKSVALGFAKEGADIFITAQKDIDGLNETIEEAKKLGVKAIGGLYDASNFKDVERLMDDVEKSFGCLDILVNNAGIIKPTPFLEINPEQFEKTLKVHLFGTYYHTWLVAKRFMVPKKSGKIINLAAPAAFRGYIGVVDYATAKGGIAAFTKNVAKELLPYNIQVNAVVPVAESRMTKDLSVFYSKQYGAEVGKRLASLPSPDNLIGTFLFFASSDSDYVTGQFLTADGGWSD
jgi:3-oxoacyl-[acyl-carrier protein] reductase